MENENNKGIDHAEEIARLTKALQIGLGSAAFLAGLDKFTNLLTDWEKYLNPRAEELLPFRFDTPGVLLKARIEVLEVLRIAAIEERAAGEGCVGVLARHKAIVLSVAPDRRPRAGRTQWRHSLYYVCCKCVARKMRRLARLNTPAS